MISFKEYIHEVYQEEPGGSFTDNGADYDLNKLFKLVDRDPVAYFTTKDLKWVLSSEPDIDMERVKAADLTAPLLVGIYEEKKKRKWVVLDGVHRLYKAVQDGVEFLPGKFVPPELEQKTRTKK